MSLQDVLSNGYSNKVADEMYEVVFETELVRDMETYRLEILRSVRPDTFYCSRLTKKITASVQDASESASNPNTGKLEYTGKHNEVRFFVHEELPYVHMPTAEQALAQSLGFFAAKFSD